MNADDILAAVAVINPNTLARARRLAGAIVMLEAGVSASEARRIVRERFGCNRHEAWHIVRMAVEIAGDEEEVHP